MSNVNIGIGDRIKCPHCGGGGKCKEAIIQGIINFPKKYWCDRCGSGNVIRSAETALDDGMFPKRPTCAVCGGTGQARA